MPIPTDRQREIVRMAEEVIRYAHCPYTKFPVGAAVYTTDERIFAAPNIENASPALSICAARNAVFQAVSAGSDEIVLVVIYTPTKEPKPPCGCCRQVINEFCTDAHVYCVCDGTQVIHRRISELLPDAFGAHLL